MKKIGIVAIQREIKFRAWSSTDKKMYYHFIMGSDGAIRDQVSGLNRFDVFQQKDLMQYTGLNDKNGKEIYEGDIVETSAMHDDEYLRFVCVYECPSFIMTSKDDSQTGFSGDHYIVIGNIYQNNNLIK